MRVSDLVEALYRRYLEPPDYQPVVAFLASDMSSSDEFFTLGPFAVPEDAQLLRVGVLAEAGSELMRVTAYDSLGSQVTVNRGWGGSLPAVHSLGSEVKLSPPYPRMDAFEAVATNITSLSPALYTVANVHLSEVNNGVAPIDDELAHQCLGISLDYMGEVVAPGEIFDFHPIAGGRACQTATGIGDFWLRYTRRMGVATALTDELAALGVEETWAPAVVVGAAADLLVGRDVSRTHVEWVAQVFETEGVSVGKRQQVAMGLAQYRTVLIDRYRREMDAEYKPVVRMRDPFARTRGGSF